MEHPAGRAALERLLPAEVAARLLQGPLHVFVLELPLKKLPMLSQGAVDAATVARIVEVVPRG